MEPPLRPTGIGVCGMAGAPSRPNGHASCQTSIRVVGRVQFWR